jgi:hypothetical protein
VYLRVPVTGEFAGTSRAGTPTGQMRHDEIDGGIGKLGRRALCAFYAPQKASNSSAGIFCAGHGASYR